MNHREFEIKQISESALSAEQKSELIALKNRHFDLSDKIEALRLERQEIGQKIGELESLAVEAKSQFKVGDIIEDKRGWAGKVIWRGKITSFTSYGGINCVRVLKDGSLGRKFYASQNSVSKVRDLEGEGA